MVAVKKATVLLKKNSMKRNALFLLLLVNAAMVTAQSATIRITGTRFTFPVFNIWASVYRQAHPEVNIVIASGIAADSADILIASHILKQGDVKDGQTGLALGRYVQLPVVNSARKDLEKIIEKGFTDETVKEIYFTDSAQRPADVTTPFTVYKRQKAACSSVSFANHFGGEHKDIKGIGVAGDDVDLLASVKRDVNAVSHNSLGIIYNLTTRKINDSIAIVPIDLNENGQIDAAEKMYSTVDNVVAFAEKTNHPKIPIENINVIFSKTSNRKAVADFLSWVITKGQQFNHDFGLLNLAPAIVEEEQKILAQNIQLKSCTPSMAQLKSKVFSAN